MGPENQLRHVFLLADNEGGGSAGMFSFLGLELDLLRGKKWNPVFQEPGHEPQQQVISITVVNIRRSRQPAISFFRHDENITAYLFMKSTG